MKILIVDDKEEERYLAETVLKGSGYEVVTAVNGAEALEKLRAEGCDMIVSDILMPVMDGFRLCRECKGDEKLKDIPFIFYTATYKDERDEELASKVGADKFIRKPIEPEEFVKLIQGVFRDVEEGKIGPKKLVLEEEREVLKLYSERLIAKLEKKTLDLERENTERKGAEEEVHRLNQILQLARRINQLIVQTDNELELLQKACNRFVDRPNYKLAWIGFTQEGSYDVLPVAQVGFEEGYLSSVKITWDDSEYGRGPTAMAIKTGRPFAMRDILHDERYRPWRDEALKQGYMSSIALPLTVAGKVIGAVNVYSEHPDAFDDAELGLLIELAGDISLGIEKIRLREERKQAEEEVRRLSNAVRMSTESIVISDLEANIIDVNEATLKMYGTKDKKDLIGKNSFELIATGEREKALEGMREVLEKGHVKDKEYHIITEDGSEIIVEMSVATMKAPNGKPIGFVAVSRDITERRRVEEALREVEVLRETDRLKSELLANVSHELRTPLASIKGFATTLLQPDVKWDEKEQRDFLQTIDQEADRLTRIISDLLDMSRLESGTLKLEKHDYQVSEILDSVSSRLASLTQHHQLQVMVPAELPSVSVDEMRIGQVLTNLVENATKFSREGSQITVEAQLIGDQVIVSVTDRGQGIPSELLDRVFDRFYQTEAIVTGRKSGTGLGLSICRGIIEEHGGKIWVESKVGEGSKFRFSLPASRREEQVA